MKNSEIKREIAALVKSIALEHSYERGAIAAVDLLLQWQESKKLYYATRDAWLRDMEQRRCGGIHTDTLRHGAWVPATPL